MGRKVLGKRIESTPVAAAFSIRPLWSYVAKLRTDIPGPGGEIVQVSRGEAERFREILESLETYPSLATPERKRYYVFAESDADWSALIVRVSPAGDDVGARVTSVPLAESIADALNRIADQEARKPKSARYWFRGF